MHVHVCGDFLEECSTWHIHCTCRLIYSFLFLLFRYISNPLLIEGRKFDIRVYMLLIAGEKSIHGFYRDGYIRLSCLPYDAKSMDVTIHLTNQYIQKKHPLYTDVKEDTVNYVYRGREREG